MSDQDDRHETFEIEERSQPGLLRRMPWWLIGSIAFAIGELTTHPAIGIVVLCLKFGWNDFLIGLWLRRRDPDRKRGAVCSWFYWALGLWRVGMWSFILFFGLMFMLGMLQAHPEKGKDPIEIAYFGSIIAGSIILAPVATFIGILRGWMTGRRVWLSSTIFESYQRREWPPVAAVGAPNLLKRIVIMTGCMTLVFVLPVFVLGVISLLGAAQIQPVPQNAGAGVFGAVVGAGVPIGGACLVLWTCSAILKRLEADRPDRCWTDPESHDDFGISSDGNDEAWR